MTRRHISQIPTGTRIRERRLAMSRRQSEVARAAGISAAYLNLIEHNRRPAGEALLARLAAILEISPEELAHGHHETRVTALREAAARLPGGVGVDETGREQASDLVARFPGWAEVLIGTARRADALERQLIRLSDRMTQDPYLLSTLHEVLTAVTALRSTAAILAEGGPIPSDLQQRFHANLEEDSLRLSRTAQSLVAYLDSFGADGAVSTPQDEVDAWLAQGMPRIDDPDGPLTSGAARAMAARHLAQIEADRNVLSDTQLSEALAALSRDDAPAGSASEPDPLLLAARLGQPLDLVLRRLAMARPPGFTRAGLLACDGSGAITLRRVTDGFPLPRPGDSCSLWPLFLALANPQTALHTRVEVPDGRQFRTISYATRHQPGGINGPLLTNALMLIMPAETVSPDPVTLIGPTCRTCPRDPCPARREPSILTTAHTAQSRSF